MSSGKLRQYEVMVLFPGDLAEDAIKKEIEVLTSEITSNGGEVLFEDFWGKRKLSYMIAKQDFGFYHVILFRAENAFVTGFEKELRLNKKVLRHLVTMTPQGYQAITSGEVDASEDRYFTEMRAKKASGKNRRPVGAVPMTPPKEQEKASVGTAEERSRKLDQILSSDLKV